MWYLWGLCGGQGQNSEEGMSWETKGALGWRWTEGTAAKVVGGDSPEDQDAVAVAGCVGVPRLCEGRGLGKVRRWQEKKGHAAGQRALG